MFQMIHKRDYRIVIFTGEDESETINWHEICEVFYDKDGNPRGYCYLSLGGKTPDELKENYEALIAAWQQPTLMAATMIHMKDLQT